MAQAYPCVIAAPSMLPPAPGQRVKTHRLDRRARSETLRGGQLQSVHVPAPVYRALRYLPQLRDTGVGQAVAMTQRSNSLVLFAGMAFPPAPAGRGQWSLLVKAQLRTLPCSPTVRFTLDQLLASLAFAEQHALKATRGIRRSCHHAPELSPCLT